jgi:hypothetical protein
MSRKDNLKKRIDELCGELNITEPQYDDKTTEAQLNAIIDELEAKLPDGDESENEDEDQSQTQGNDVDNPASGENQEAEIQTSDKAEVLVGIGELPEGETISDDGVIPVAKTNDQGEMQVLVTKPFQYVVDGKPVLAKSGEKPFLDEDTAMEAVEAGLAHIIATL